ncbi:hypothetical protein EVAR_52659_1 [Eumeta japonica]|uniref:Uncharacterized protein n=1 Tax=Eumeta variegata TaxID=151549 RepID=A0A4C1Z433_EUMVA|nr:hypothetical protein EVAR_52659_1 [Eumeta japonica]
MKLTENIQREHSVMHPPPLTDDLSGVVSEGRPQRIIDLLPHWLDNWRVVVNVKKTTTILSGLQRTMPPQLRSKDKRWSGNAVSSVTIQTAAPSQARPIQGLHPIPAKLCQTDAVRAVFHSSTSQNPMTVPVEHRSVTIKKRAMQYIRNDMIACDFRVESVEEFIQRITRRIFDLVDRGPYLFLQNIAPQLKWSPSE